MTSIPFPWARFGRGRGFAWAFLAVVAAAGSAALQGQAAAGQSAGELKGYFQRTEQSLMDAVAVGNKALWNDVLDEACVVTNEEGEVLGKKELLEQLTGLPPGLSGAIEVVDLTVQPAGDFAVVRFRMNETETVFGQHLKTGYRSTDTFVRRDAGWKMIASHQSVVTSDPPAQEVSRRDWPAFAGTYQLLPNGWVLHVAMKDGELYAGRDPKQLKRLIPIGPNVFTREGSLGEWVFCLDEKGKATKIVELRKFEPLVWTAVPRHS
ncbi:nuclear transport factor 2 family protein [Acidobacteria bacterium AB60]|nr:nuclear transport factor 2 family protein [Acidobacteria bacterium AB60]